MDTPDRTAAENAGDADYCWELLATAERLLRDGTSDGTDGIALIEHALTECGTDPAVALSGHLALAQILGPQVLDVETERLEEVVRHARRAVEAAIELGYPEPACSSAYAALGRARLRLAQRLPVEDFLEALVQATDDLKTACERTSEDDPNRMKRLANYAGALLRSVPDLDRQRTRLQEAWGIYDELLSLELGSAPFNVLINSAHCAQQSAAVARTGGDLDEVVGWVNRSEELYIRALKAAEENGEAAGGALMGLARLKFEAAEGGPDHLDQAISLGTSALTKLREDLGFEREATMQLAGMHLARYRQLHLPSDAALADDLSSRALHSWHHQRGSIEFDRARAARIEVLTSVTLSDVGTDDHYVELDELLTGAYGENDRTPQMEAIRALADVIRVLQPETDSADEIHAALVECADRLESVLASTTFVADDPVWWVRWFGAHVRIARWAEWAAIDMDHWVGALDDAESRMASRLGALDQRSEGYALANRQLAFAAKARAVHKRDPVDLARALSLLEVARLHDEQLTLTHMIDLGTDGAYMCEILGRDPSKWIDYAIAAAGRMEHQPSAPLAARLSTSRPRCELAGVAAANEADPSELAWTLHRVCQPLKADDGARHAFMKDLDELSRDLTMVFLAQSRLRCRAAVLRSGTWTTVDLPNLALDKIGHVVVAAHHAHTAAESGSIAARTRWSAARNGLSSALASALLPLVAMLAAEQRPVVLRLSGWGHAMPIAPLLMAQLGYSQAVVVSLGLPRAPTARPRPAALAALAAPGDGRRFRHLPLALDDAEHVARLFGTRAIEDATKEDLAAALQTASTVLVACHGASAEKAEMSRLVLHDGDLTAAELVALDLHGLELVVIAACESSATDRSAPAHPFNVQAVIVMAGARLACGPQWAIDDAVASAFTRSLFESIAAGSGHIEAYRAGSAQASAVTDDFRDLTLLIRDDWCVLEHR
jgi:hypothetical protein